MAENPPTEIFAASAVLKFYSMSNWRAFLNKGQASQLIFAKLLGRQFHRQVSRFAFDMP